MLSLPERIFLNLLMHEAEQKGDIKYSTSEELSKELDLPEPLLVLCLERFTQEKYLQFENDCFSMTSQGRAGALQILSNTAKNFLTI